MSTDRTSMDDLLSRRVVDEREKSPDDAPSGSIAESNEPEAFTDTEALPAGDAQPAAKAEQPAKTDAEPAKPAAQADADDTGTETKGLPRAFHARVKAADERKRLAEERATTLERENAELRRRYEQGQQQPEAYQDDTDQGQPEINVDPQLHATRLYYSEREANRDFGAEQVAEAKAWGQDICATNPQFNAAVFQHPDPIRFVIEQFRKVQVEQQLAEHGWDLDKLVKARAGALQTQPAPATAPAASHTAQPTQPQPRMPNDFASSNSGGGRVNGDNAGPTPLSELLSVNARRR